MSEAPRVSDWAAPYALEDAEKIEQQQHRKGHPEDPENDIGHDVLLECQVA